MHVLTALGVPAKTRVGTLQAPRLRVELPIAIVPVPRVTIRVLALLSPSVSVLPDPTVSTLLLSASVPGPVSVRAGPVVSEADRVIVAPELIVIKPANCVVVAASELVPVVHVPGERVTVPAPVRAVMPALKW